MSMRELNDELENLLRIDRRSQKSFIKQFDQLYDKFHNCNFEQWQNRSNRKNSLLHELVDKELSDVIRHVVNKYQFNVNIRRATDGLTPLDLASANKHPDMCDLLKELGATDVQVEDVSKWRSDEDREKAMNIVWVDLEMTSIEDPNIMECAVIITDKNLDELARRQWVIGFDESVLKTLGEWHQKTFADRDQNGNGLFADVLKSNLTKEQVEEELLDLIKLHCPPQMCPLAGSSIHIDKHVLQLKMPKVHEYLHYRIIDVSSFQGIMRRWAPWIEKKIKDQLAKKGQESVNHRAMDDIEWSISFMKEFRPILTKQSPRGVNNKPRHSPERQQQRHHSPERHQHRHHSSPPPHFKRSSSESHASGNSDPPKINHGNDSSELYADERRLLERMSFEKNYPVKSLRLDDKGQHLYDSNPHLREVFMNKERIQNYEKDFTRDDRYLETLPHSARSNNSDWRKSSTTEHWGQRKLLLPEIEFLTKYGTDDGYHVVYAGSVPSSHINYLASLFPGLDFILIDEKTSATKLASNLEIRSEKFTDDLAKRYSSSSKKILFICNVRTYRPQDRGQSTVMEDMEHQMIWHHLMKSQVSLLSFRLPRESGRTKYLKGHQIIEPWASKKSLECRLVVKKDAKTIDYDYQEFENALNYFHNVTRVMYYKHNIDDVNNEGLDHCYDCRAEIFILQEYIKAFKKANGEAALKFETARMSSEISKRIGDEKRKAALGFVRTLDAIPKKSADASTYV